MDASLVVVEGLRFVVFGGLAVAAIRTWRRSRDVAGAWVAATFVVLAVVVVVAGLIPRDAESAGVDWARKLLVAGLLLVPFFLYRFAVSFDERRPRFDTLATVCTAALVGIALGAPRFPDRMQERPTWLTVYVVVVAVVWTCLSWPAVRRLWQAGRGQSAVVRQRMRVMALGALVLNIGAVAVAMSGRTAASVVLGLAAAGLFLVGFDPPRLLRAAWRQPDLVSLRHAEAALMQATALQEVADVVLPYATRLLGAKGAVLATADGAVAAAYGVADDEATALAALAPTGAGNVLAVPLRHLFLAVHPGRCAPFFGSDEIELLRGLAVFGGLALDRVDLFEQERASRERAEQANTELETFVYSVSHDLKSPLVSIAGFLAYLRDELGEVEGDSAFYLERMDAGVRYMEALIQDLLELSRIGRVSDDASDVDLGRVAREAADDLSPMRPAASVDVDDLPVVHMSPLRARQLFTNLVGNALAHAGREDVRVEITSQELPDGGVRIVVSDDGKGIPPAYRERVFRVFERLERGTPRSGTGIGLAVCRKIVEQAGGSIRVGDRPTGTAFEIDLPAAVVRGPGARLEEAR